MGGGGKDRLSLPQPKDRKLRQDAAAGVQGSGRPAVKWGGLNWVTTTLRISVKGNLGSMELKIPIRQRLDIRG